MCIRFHVGTQFSDGYVFVNNQNHYEAWGHVAGQGYEDSELQDHTKEQVQGNGCTMDQVGSQDEWVREYQGEDEENRVKVRVCLFQVCDAVA